MRNDQAISRFRFSRDGLGSRCDKDAKPVNLLTGVDFQNHRVLYHPAGDRYVRARHVFDAIADEAFIDGFEPNDAVRIALEYARAERLQRERGSALDREAAHADA